MDDSAKGGLAQFSEHFTVIPCALKDFVRKYHRYLREFGSQMRGSLGIIKGRGLK